MEEERKGMRRRRLRGKSSTRQTLDRVLGSIQKPIPTPLTQPREDLLEPKAGRTETAPHNPVELFQILKDDAVKVQHWICQQLK